MRLKNTKSGFTLLEIIVVIIIVGVLASLALPRFFETVEFSRSSEAVNVLGVVKRAAERCAMMGGDGDDFSTCTSWGDLGIEDPANSNNAHFTYGTGPAWSNPNLTITATRNTNNGGDTADSIQLNLNTTTGAVTRSGAGRFSGVK